MKVKSIAVVVAVVVVVAVAVWMIAGIRVFSVKPDEPEDNVGDATNSQPEPDNDAEERRGEVFRIAGEIRGKDVEKLLPYLEDESPRVRLAAARAVYEKDPVGQFDRLLKVLRDEDATVRASVAQMLGRTRNSKLIGEYAWIIAYDKEVRVKMAALDGLKEVGEELCLLPMIEALQDESVVVRKHAATRLSETAFHRIEGTEQGGEEDYSKWVAWWKEKRLPKYATHEGLEKLKTCNDAVSVLLIAESPDLGNAEVRATAVSVLSTMSGERAQAVFRGCLNSSDEMVCIAAINAVLAGKLIDYVEDLENLAKNSNSEAVRLKATQALSILHKE